MMVYSEWDRCCLFFNCPLTLCYLQFGIPIIYRCRLLSFFRLLVSLLSFVPTFLSLCPSFFLSFLFVSWAFPPEPSLVWYLFFPSFVSFFFFFLFFFYFCVVLCFLCGLCPRVESLFVVVTCDHGICISQDESIGTEFGCTGWLSEWKDRFNVTIIQYNTIVG